MIDRPDNPVPVAPVPVAPVPVGPVPDGWTVVLASGSPRRRELLHGVGLRVAVRPADIDESVLTGESPVQYVGRLCLEKAAAAAGPTEIVIAADTTVVVDGEILEKPVDDSDARRMLRALSGRSHLVHTGVCVTGPNVSLIDVVTTEVFFVDLSEEMIDWYLDTGEAADKAGAYGIQGAAGVFVTRVDGSVSNVIGLPLAETLAMLQAVLQVVRDGVLDGVLDGVAGR